MATQAENAQNQWLKRFLATALYLLGPLFLYHHNLESIKAFVITLGSKSELNCLYSAGFELEHKTLELYQDCVKEVILDYMVIEIIGYKKLRPTEYS